MEMKLKFREKEVGVVGGEEVVTEDVEIEVVAALNVERKATCLGNVAREVD